MLYVLNIANKFCQNNLDHGYSVSPFGWVTIQELDVDAVAIDILSNPGCGETGPIGAYWAYWGLLGLLGPTGAKKTNCTAKYSCMFTRIGQKNLTKKCSQ